MALSLLQVFTFVYVFDKKEGLPTKDLIPILDIILKYVQEARMRVTTLWKIAQKGLYEQVFPADDPSLVDYK